MDEDLEELLRHERERPTLSRARVDRMWQAVAAELAMLPPGTASESQLTKPATESTTVAATPLRMSAPTIAPLLRHVTLVAKAHLPWMAISFGLGSTGGLVAGRSLEKQHVPAATSVGLSPTAPEVIPSLPTLEIPTPSIAAPPSSVASTTVHGGQHDHRPIGARDVALDSEQEMLRRAEDALHRGDWAGVLSQTTAYTARFPRGELSEENAYLAIRACLQSGDEVRARARLEDFHKRFPRSPLGIRLDK
jgi:hypothetical protein